MDIRRSDRSMLEKFNHLEKGTNATLNQPVEDPAIFTGASHPNILTH